jgi:hypothetical protein
LRPRCSLSPWYAPSLELARAYLTYSSSNLKRKPGGTSLNSTCWHTTSLSLVCRLCTLTSTAPKTTRSAN